MDTAVRVQEVTKENLFWSNFLFAKTDLTYWCEIWGARSGDCENYCLLPPSSTLKMEGAGFSEILIIIYWNTWRHFPGDSSFQFDTDICFQLPYIYNIKREINASVLLSSCQGFRPRKKLLLALHLLCYVCTIWLAVILMSVHIKILPGTLKLLII
jgi:hypothetical protein